MKGKWAWAKGDAWAAILIVAGILVCLLAVPYLVAADEAPQVPILPVTASAADSRIHLYSPILRPVPPPQAAPSGHVYGPPQCPYRTWRREIPIPGLGRLDLRLFCSPWREGWDPGDTIPYGRLGKAP